MAKATDTKVVYVKANPGKKNRRRKKNGLKIPMSLVIPVALIGKSYHAWVRDHGFERGTQELVLWFGIDMRRDTPALTTEYLRNGAYPREGQ